MNKLLVYGSVLVLIVLVIIYTTKENSSISPFKGCTYVASPNQCKTNFLSYSFVVPNELGHEARAATVSAGTFLFGASASVAPAAKFARAGTAGRAASAYKAASEPKIGTNSVAMNICCDTIENMNNAKHEIKLMELDNKINLLEHLLPPYVKSKIKTNVNMNARGPKSYNLQPRLIKLEQRAAMDGIAVTQLGRFNRQNMNEIARINTFLNKGPIAEELQKLGTANAMRKARAEYVAKRAPAKSNSFFSFLGF